MKKNLHMKKASLLRKAHEFLQSADNPGSAARGKKLYRRTESGELPQRRGMRRERERELGETWKFPAVSAMKHEPAGCSIAFARAEKNFYEGVCCVGLTRVGVTRVAPF